MFGSEPEQELDIKGATGKHKKSKSRVLYRQRGHKPITAGALKILKSSRQEIHQASTRRTDEITAKQPEVNFERCVKAGNEGL